MFFVTKLGKEYFPSSDTVNINTIKDTVSVVVVQKRKEVNTSKIKETSKLKDEIEYWKNKASDSDERITSLENKFNRLEKEKKHINTGNTSRSKVDKGVNFTPLENNNIPVSTIKKPLPNYGLNKSINNIKGLFPNKNGYSTSSMSENILNLICPNFEVNNQKINLYFTIDDTATLNKIACIAIHMTRIDKSNKYHYVYDEYYKPQYGINHIIIDNVSTRDRTKYKLTMGALLYTDRNNSSPYVYGPNCTFYK